MSGFDCTKSIHFPLKCKGKRSFWKIPLVWFWMRQTEKKKTHTKNTNMMTYWVAAQLKIQHHHNIALHETLLHLHYILVVQTDHRCWSSVRHCSFARQLCYRAGLRLLRWIISNNPQLSRKYFRCSFTKQIETNLSLLESLTKHFILLVVFQSAVFACSLRDGNSRPIHLAILAPEEENIYLNRLSESAQSSQSRVLNAISWGSIGDWCHYSHNHENYPRLAGRSWLTARSLDTPHSARAPWATMYKQPTHQLSCTQ